jgi:hypothetical protein
MFIVTAAPSAIALVHRMITEFRDAHRYASGN